MIRKAVLNDSYISGLKKAIFFKSTHLCIEHHSKTRQMEKFSLEDMAFEVTSRHSDDMYS